MRISVAALSNSGWRARARASGGYRSIILFRYERVAFFVHGFAKRDRDTIDRDELLAFRKLASTMLNLDREGMSTLLARSLITEVDCSD